MDLFVIGRHFTSIKEAEAINLTYVRTVGFRVRKNFKCKADNGKMKIKRWVCSKKGFRLYKYLHNNNKKWAPRPII